MVYHIPNPRQGCTVDSRLVFTTGVRHRCLLNSLIKVPASGLDGWALSIFPAGKALHQLQSGIFSTSSRRLKPSLNRACSRTCLLRNHSNSSAVGFTLATAPSLTTGGLSISKFRDALQLPPKSRLITLLGAVPGGGHCQTASNAAAPSALASVGSRVPLLQRCRICAYHARLPALVLEGRVTRWVPLCSAQL